MRGVLPLLVGCALLAGCDVDVDTQAQTAGGALDAGEPPVVRVCRAATMAFNPKEPAGARTVPLASAETVRMAYEAGEGGVGLTVECAFQGDQVTWRLLSVSVPSAGVTAPAQRAPETATYAVQGDKVRLNQKRADGTSTEVTWSSTEQVVRSVNINASTGAE